MNIRATVLNKPMGALTQKHMIIIMSGDANSVRRRRQKTGPHVAGLFELNRA
jgi:hypothetical protein